MRVEKKHAKIYIKEELLHACMKCGDNEHCTKSKVQREKTKNRRKANTNLYKNLKWDMVPWRSEHPLSRSFTKQVNIHSINTFYYFCLNVRITLLYMYINWSNSSNSRWTVRNTICFSCKTTLISCIVI